MITLSATQIALGDSSPGREGCLRKYAFRYVCGIRDAETPAMRIGLDVEQLQLTPYLLEGRPFDDTPEGRIAAPALGLLPQPKTPGLVLQHEFRISNDRYGFLGYKDCRLADGGLFRPADGTLFTGPTVIDFKTTGSWGFRKTAKRLATDVQATLYALDELIAAPELDFVDLYWLTMRTKDSPKAEGAHYRAHKDHVAEQFAHIESVAETLYEIRINAPPVEAGPEALKAYALSLEPNANACRAFNRDCPHRGTCNLAPKTHRAAEIVKLRRTKEPPMTMNGTALSALERLKARKPVVVAAVAPAAIEPALGINPPEKDLPPPPVAAPPEPEVVEVQVVEADVPCADKPKRGRKPGSKNQPKTEEKYGQYLTDEYLNTPATIPAPPAVPSFELVEGDLLGALRAAAIAFLGATGGT